MTQKRSRGPRLPGVGWAVSWSLPHCRGNPAFFHGPGRHRGSGTDSKLRPMIPQGDFDTDTVIRLRGLGGELLVSRIATLFADFAAARVADAESARGTGDLARVAFAAHAIRSSAA